MLHIFAPALNAVTFRASYAAVSIPPNPSGIPGIKAFDSLVGGVKVFAISCCVLAVIIGAISYGLGRHFSNHNATSKGMGFLLGGLGAAILIAGADYIVTFAQGIGSTIQ